MPAWPDELVQRLLALPDAVVYLLLALAAAVENIFPPVPADVVVLIGGAMAGSGEMDPWIVFLAVWSGNVAGALGIYAVGRRYGPGFFTGRVGELLLRPRQLTSLSAFYRRYGVPVIFFSRFLPMFRAVVPVFAGVSNLGFWATALPLALASGLWYGMLVYLGAAFGRNLPQILEALAGAGLWLWGVAAVIAGIAAVLWWRSRHPVGGDG